MYIAFAVHVAADAAGAGANAVAASAIVTAAAAVTLRDRRVRNGPSPISRRAIHGERGMTAPASLGLGQIAQSDQVRSHLIPRPVRFGAAYDAVGEFSPVC